MPVSQLRSLFITKEVPYPPKGGVSLRNWQNMNILAQYGEVGVFSAANWSPKRTELPQIARWVHCNVEQQRSRRENVLRRLWWLFPQQHPDCDWPYAEVAAEKLQQLMETFKPDLVILEQVWLYRYLPIVKQFPCRIILDQHNVEAHLFAQSLSQKGNWRSKLKNQLMLSHLKTIEQTFCQRVDQIWTCSDSDSELFKQCYEKAVPTMTVPNGLNVANYHDIHNNTIDLPEGIPPNPQTILFVGLLSYPPNKEAVELLLEEIFPLLKSGYPNCRLLIVGANASRKMQHIADNDPNIVLTGDVTDVKPYLAAASIVVVPLRQGGGTRLKILEAFASLRPVVTTTKGAEGLNATDEEHLLIRDSPETMVEAIGRLWSEKSLGDKLTCAAYELIKAQYSWEAVGKTIEKELSSFSRPAAK